MQRKAKQSKAKQSKTNLIFIFFATKMRNEQATKKWAKIQYEKREATKAGFYLLLIYQYIWSVSANIYTYCPVL